MGLVEKLMFLVGRDNFILVGVCREGFLGVIFWVGFSDLGNVDEWWEKKRVF